MTGWEIIHRIHHIHQNRSACQTGGVVTVVDVVTMISTPRAIQKYFLKSRP